MKIKLAVAIAVLMSSLGVASAASVTAPAWQEPGFVMEEVVVTATAEDVAMAAREQQHRRARQLVAARMRSNLGS